MAIHIYYPSTDGWAQHFASGGLSWTDIKLASGNSSNGSSDTMSVRIQSDTVSNIYHYNRRIKIAFDTSNLSPETDIITAGNLQTKVESVTNEFSYDFSLNLYGSTATTTTIQDSDYEKNPFLATELATSVDWSDYGINDILELDLNSNGFSFIKMDGDTIFSIRESRYDGSAFSPSWESDKNAQLELKSSEQTGTDNDPKLTLVIREKSIINTKVLTTAEQHSLGLNWYINTASGWVKGEKGHIQTSAESWNKFFDTS